MKKYYFLFCYCLFSFGAKSQITLTTTDFPEDGDQYVISDATEFTGMDATLTGANYTWDFSQLGGTTTGQHTDTFFSVSNMNIIYQAVFGDFGFLPHRSNQALHGPDFTLGTQIAVTDVYNFYYNNSSDYHQSGFGAEINGIPVPTPYDPHDIIYKYPIEFGNMDSSYSGYEVELPNFLYYGVSRKRVNEVDGWGTLITPSGTYSVLRLKSTITERDSVFLDTLGFGYGFDLPEQVEYKWLGQNEGVPLLQINVAAGFVSAITYKGVNTTGVSIRPDNQLDFFLFPNPAVERLFLRYHVDQKTTVRYSITDANGNFVIAQTSLEVQPGNQIQMVELPSRIAAGTYFMNVSAGDRLTTKAFTVSTR